MALLLFTCFLLLLPHAPASLLGAVQHRVPALTTMRGFAYAHTSAPPLPAAFRCSAAEARAQLSRLVVSESSCPSSDVWPLLYAAGLHCQSQATLVVNVGANKGYKAASLLAALRPQLGVTPAALYAKLAAEVMVDVEDVGGLCGDAGEVQPPSLAPPCPDGTTPLEMHLFEPLPGNVALLEAGLLPLADAAAVARGNDTHALPISLHLHAAALIGDAGVSAVDFGGCASGNERCGVRVEGGGDDGGEIFSRGNVVPAVTLDAWVAGTSSITGGGSALAGRTLDVLCIDAEGLDPEVLRGASALLARRGVRVLELEYHSLRSWGKTSLQAVAEDLEAVGYDCFFLQQHGDLVRITGCWAPEMEFRSWSNVLCVLRTEAGMLALLNSRTPLVSGRFASPDADAVSVVAANAVNAADAAVAGASAGAGEGRGEGAEADSGVSLGTWRLRVKKRSRKKLHIDSHSPLHGAAAAAAASGEAGGSS